MIPLDTHPITNLMMAFFGLAVMHLQEFDGTKG
jgi:hypothetical protein